MNAPEEWLRCTDARRGTETDLLVYHIGVEIKLTGATSDVLR